MSDPGHTDLRDVAAVCAAVGLTAPPEIWQTTWPQSEAAFTPGRVPFLDPDFVPQACVELCIGGDVSQLLTETATAIAASPPLERLAWHCHWLLYLSGLEAGLRDWPPLPAAAGSAAPLLYAVVLLSGLPSIRARHQVRGIDPAVTVQSLADLELWIRETHRQTGSWGLKNLGWPSHGFTGSLFWLGRLEYVPGHYYHPFRFYRNRKDRTVLALAEDGLLLRGDGQFASADSGAVRDGLWRSRFAADAREMSGNPVSPWGRVLPTTVVLDANEWCEVLRRGDPVMTVHIPASGPMDPPACGASFVQAVDFYRRHYPETVFHAFTCSSWLLDPQFEAMAPAPPNIVAFLREWYLHPVENASDGQTFERAFDVFDWGGLDLATAPQDTSLRRAIVKFMQAGGRCRGGGSVLFPEDLDWGRQVYRTDCHPQVR